MIIHNTFRLVGSFIGSVGGSIHGLKNFYLVFWSLAPPTGLSGDLSRFSTKDNYLFQRLWLLTFRTFNFNQSE
jgi:hypothetical protein